MSLGQGMEDRVEEKVERNPEKNTNILVCKSGFRLPGSKGKGKQKAESMNRPIFKSKPMEKGELPRLFRSG